VIVRSSRTCAALGRLFLSATDADDATAVVDLRDRLSLPTLIVISGPAGSGKTRLAHALAEAIGCPAVCRDEIKEGMVHAEGRDFRASVGDALTRRTFPLFFEVIRLLVTAGVTVVAEAAFQDPRWRDGLAPMLSLARLRIIQCTVSDAVARERVARRMGDPSRRAHADADWLVQQSTHPFERLSLPAPSVTVDTTGGYVPDLSEIVAFVCRP
jgi:predicted kinase